MKGIKIATTALAICLASIASAQSADDLNEGSELIHDPLSNVYTFKWWGKSGRTYFIQHSDDMINWNYIPAIESGVGGLLQYGLTSSEEKLFTRLQYTDQPSSNPETDDFDGDGISNIDEITMAPVQGNPLDAGSEDGDPLPDDFERYHGLNVEVAATSDTTGAIKLEVH